MRGSFVVGPGVIAAIVMLASTGVAGRQAANTPPLDSCEALRSFRQPDVTIVDASLIPAGQVHHERQRPAGAASDRSPTAAWKRASKAISAS